MLPWIGHCDSLWVIFSCRKHMTAGNPDSIKTLIFEVKLCICYNKYLAIYVSNTLKQVTFAEAR